MKHFKLASIAVIALLLIAGCKQATVKTEAIGSFVNPDGSIPADGVLKQRRYNVEDYDSYPQTRCLEDNAC